MSSFPNTAAGYSWEDTAVSWRGLSAENCLLSLLYTKGPGDNQHPPDNRRVIRGHSELKKALLDLVYLTPKAEQLPYLQQLRLQNLEIVDQQVLADYAHRFDKQKLR